MTEHPLQHDEENVPTHVIPPEHQVPVQEAARDLPSGPVPQDEDETPAYEMPPENQVPPSELPEDVKEKLGIKLP